MSPTGAAAAATCAASGRKMPAGGSGMRSSQPGGEVPDDPLVQPFVQRGEAGWVLVSMACCPGDLLVVGAGRRGALARMVSGKVSRYCLAHAQCPVLAVPPPAFAQEVRHGPLAWAFWHRTLAPDRVLRDHGRAAA